MSVLRRFGMGKIKHCMVDGAGQTWAILATERINNEPEKIRIYYRKDGSNIFSRVHDCVINSKELIMPENEIHKKVYGVIPTMDMEAKQSIPPGNTILAVAAKKLGDMQRIIYAQQMKINHLQSVVREAVLGQKKGIMMEAEILRRMNMIHSTGQQAQGTGVIGYQQPEQEEEYG